MTSAWYIRSKRTGAIKGPFPAGQIAQEVLLGRYNQNDEVSHDKEAWQQLGDVQGLLPDVLNEDKDDPNYNNRLDAARRWADERREVSKSEEFEERREGESYEKIELKRLHQSTNETRIKSNSFAMFVQIVFVIAAISTVIVLAFQYSPKNESVVDCSEKAKQGVNWSNCDFSGIQLLNSNLVAVNLMGANLQTANLSSSDLSHANLQYAKLHLANLTYVKFTKANLKGANLLGAKLLGASFKQADLSYVNLRDADITNTDFSDARLYKTIWIDGRVCAESSIGTCD